MKRRAFLKNMAVAALATTLWSCAEKTLQKKNNLIFILADDLGYGDIECFGGRRIKTPHLDALADEGIKLTNFHTAAAVCSPTRASCLTGRYPLRFNITAHFSDHEEHLPRDVATLPKLLHQNGYATMHIGKWHLGGLNVKHCENREGSIPGPAQHGFDHYLCMYEDPDIRAVLLKERRLYRDGGHHLVMDDKPYPQSDKHWTDIKIEESLKFIENSHASGEPFFLNLWFDVPHTPYEPAPEPYLSPYKNRAFGDDLLYRSMVAHLDFGVGAIVKKLKELGIDKNTFIIFTSDNGPALQGDPGAMKGRKADQHQGGLNVPFIAWWPGNIKGGTQSDEFAMTTDLLPTFCSAADILVPDDANVDGLNLFPHLATNETLPERGTVFWKLRQYDYFYSEVTDVKPKPIATEIARSGRWKLLFVDGQPTELYDLEEDPYERWNLLEWRTDVVDRLKSELDDWLAEPRLACCGS
jgi:arylsulfatase A-like enzyme